MDNTLKTPYRVKLEAKEREIYEQFKALQTVGGISDHRIFTYLADKWGYSTPNAIRSMVRRVEVRKEGGES